MNIAFAFPRKFTTRNSAYPLHVFLSLVLSFKWAIFVLSNRHDYPGFCRKANVGYLFCQSQVLGG